MTDSSIILPSKPKIINEIENKGIYEIDGLYPGYGHTLGNSLRRIILSSLRGMAITSVKIDGVSHEFSTIDGVKEDVIMILLNLKKLRIKAEDDSSDGFVLSLDFSKEGSITAKEITLPAGVEILNQDQHIATITKKGVRLNIEMKINRGIGYVPKEFLSKEKVEIGTIALDATFTPIRRVNYEVENMRVGDRTDYNRLRIFVETDGSISPRDALDKSVKIMIEQLMAIVGFEDAAERIKAELEREVAPLESDANLAQAGDDALVPLESEAALSEEDIMKTRIEDLHLSPRIEKALADTSIRTIGGLARKSSEELEQISGLGEKGIAEIKRSLGNFGVTLKS